MLTILRKYLSSSVFKETGRDNFSLTCNSIFIQNTDQSFSNLIQVSFVFYFDTHRFHSPISSNPDIPSKFLQSQKKKQKQMSFQKHPFCTGKVVEDSNAQHFIFIMTLEFNTLSKSMVQFLGYVNQICEIGRHFHAQLSPPQNSRHSQIWHPVSF